MRIASWNVNHRVGKTHFRPETVDAAIALDVDAVFFNEFFPGKNGPSFLRRLSSAGWRHQVIPEEPQARANRTIVASRYPVVVDQVSMPSFDDQFPPNVLAVRFPEQDLRVLALRIPWYPSPQRQLTVRCWEWLESSASTLTSDPAIIIGDLNASPSSPPARGGEHFRRMLAGPWSLATSITEPSYWSAKGATSTLDHLLHTRMLQVHSASFVTAAGGYRLAGSAAALSDHAAIIAELSPQALDIRFSRG